MQCDDLTVRRSNSPHRAQDFIGAREAERLLGISRAVLLRLAKTERLPGKVIEKPGVRRAWRFRPSDVLRLKQDGTALKRPGRRPRIRIAWVRMFGPVPRGFTVIPRDSDNGNTAASNLALVPLRERLKTVEKIPLLRRTPMRIARWTLEQRAILKARFASQPTTELAKELGTSVCAIRAQASRMGLRKSLDYLIRRAREGRRLPLGTERLEKANNTIMVKVGFEGTQSQQWRPKHHIVWSSQHGVPVPPDFRVVFRDGNRRNFDPANLELATRDEVSARAFAKFFSYPPPLRETVRLTRKLEREIARRQVEHFQSATLQSAPKRHRGGKSRRWTQQMDKFLSRNYASKTIQELMVSLGVSKCSIRCRARRLGLRKPPETIIAEATRRAAFVKVQALGRMPCEQ